MHKDDLISRQTERTGSRFYRSAPESKETYTCKVTDTRRLQSPIVPFKACRDEREITKWKLEGEMRWFLRIFFTLYDSPHPPRLSRVSALSVRLFHNCSKVLIKQMKRLWSHVWCDGVSKEWKRSARGLSARPRSCRRDPTVPFFLIHSCFSFSLSSVLFNNSHLSDLGRLGRSQKLGGWPLSSLSLDTHSLQPRDSFPFADDGSSFPFWEFPSN